MITALIVAVLVVSSISQPVSIGYDADWRKIATFARGTFTQESYRDFSSDDTGRERRVEFNWAHVDGPRRWECRRSLVMGVEDGYGNLLLPMHVSVVGGRSTGFFESDIVLERARDVMRETGEVEMQFRYRIFSPKCRKIYGVSPFFTVRVEPARMPMDEETNLEYLRSNIVYLVPNLK
jgi:hypothetical protein